MKVYILEANYGHGDRDIEGVFTTEAKAKEAEKALEVDGVITEMELDETSASKPDLADHVDEFGYG